MAGERVREALRAYRRRFKKAAREERAQVPHELCGVTGYHRKYATTVLNRPADTPPAPPGRASASRWAVCTVSSEYELRKAPSVRTTRGPILRVQATPNSRSLVRCVV